MIDLLPISEIPPDASHDTVQLYEAAQGWLGTIAFRSAVQECIPTCPQPGDDPKLIFLADVEGARWWCPRTRPRLQFPKFT